MQINARGEPRSPTHCGGACAILVDMYEALSNFLISLSEHRLLWAFFVLGTMIVSSLTLYGFWEMVLRIPRLLVQPQTGRG